MHDLNSIRHNPKAFDAALATRALPPHAQSILDLDSTHRNALHRVETLKKERNSVSKSAGTAKAHNDNTRFDALRTHVNDLKNSIATAEQTAQTAANALHAMLLDIPNVPLADVPIGNTEQDNAELSRTGRIPHFDFQPRAHYDLPAARGLDFAKAANLSGTRFAVLTGGIAQLHRALAQFMLTLHTTQHKLTEVWIPVLVRSEAMHGTGQLPKFADDSYQTTNGWWLIPTAEVPLTNMHAGAIVNAHDLPYRYCAHTQCFRSEAGAAGRDTRGMLRQHQFEKVEMVSIVHPDHSRSELDAMTKRAEAVLDALHLPYRTIVLCTGDMGFGAQRTHDIEVWLPSENTYREISSVSLCGDFQARRMDTRFRPAQGGKPQFVHTLNGSGLAVGRTLIAVLENGQQGDGSVMLPTALHSWLGGAHKLNANGDLE